MSRNYFRAETIYLFVSMILSLRLLQARRKNSLSYISPESIFDVAYGSEMSLILNPEDIRLIL